MRATPAIWSSFVPTERERLHDEVMHLRRRNAALRRLVRGALPELPRAAPKYARACPATFTAPFPDDAQEAFAKLPPIWRAPSFSRLLQNSYLLLTFFNEKLSKIYTWAIHICRISIIHNQNHKHNVIVSHVKICRLVRGAVFFLCNEILPFFQTFSFSFSLWVCLYHPLVNERWHDIYTSHHLSYLNVVSIVVAILIFLLIKNQYLNITLWFF